jgi:serine/threonine-protein kinase RsbW
MARLPNVRLDLLNRPENVLLVREALTGVGEAIGIEGPDLSDMRTAVTEACNNVVLHAYAGEEGPLEVDVVLEEGAIEVLVRDRGVGIRQGSSPERSEPGLGVPVIEALASSAEFRELESAPGTEVGMFFAVPAAHPLEPAAPGEPVVSWPPDTPAFDDERRSASVATVNVAPTELARCVVPRLLCVLAARAHFSTDRISDSQLLADAIVAHAGESLTGGYLQMAVSVEPRDLELRVGPLPVGRAQRLVQASDVQGLGSVLERLADSHDVRSEDSHDTLMLQLLDRV